MNNQKALREIKDYVIYNVRHSDFLPGGGGLEFVHKQGLNLTRCSESQALGSQQRTKVSEIRVWN